MRRNNRIYEGTRSVFVVSDLDFIHESFVKQFNVFHARKATILDNTTFNVLIDSGLIWCRHRHLVNSTFTAIKLKMMSPCLNRCVNDLMGKLPHRLENGDQFNIFLY